MLLLLRVKLMRLGQTAQQTSTLENSQQIRAVIRRRQQQQMMTKAWQVLSKGQRQQQMMTKAWQVLSKGQRQQQMMTKAWQVLSKGGHQLLRQGRDLHWDKKAMMKEIWRA
jgi:ATPase subunit of ABC transporter with duplicated ATPase domains